MAHRAQVRLPADAPQLWKDNAPTSMTAVIGRGTGKSAMLPRPAAGKTGTTQDYRDAWFIGYTAELVAGVWLGNDDNSPMNKVTGGMLPAVAWRNFMLAATRTMPPKPLPSAPQAEESGIDRLLGWLGGAATASQGSVQPVGASRYPGWESAN